MSLLIKCPGLLNETVWGVKADDLVVGCGVVSAERCGIAVWGDEPLTDKKDGLAEGEPFSICLQGGNVVSLGIIEGKLVYSTDGFTHGSLEMQT